MRILFSFGLMILLNVLNANAQHIENNNTTRTVSIATSPLFIFEVEPTVYMQVMYKLNKKHAVAIEAGRVIRPISKPFAGNEESNLQGQQFEGWRFRPEFRFVKSTSTKSDKNNYYAIQGLIKKVQEKGYAYLYRTTPSGLTYREAVENNLRKEVWGLNLLAGQEAKFFNSNNLYSDFYTGLGFRYKHFEDNIGTNFNSTDAYAFDEKNGFSPTILLGIRIRYIPRKK